jgi:tetrapyrrole methylase family protein/MazG family protein
MTGRVTVVGLGPAGADHLLPAARAALEQCTNRFVRTRRHPAVDELEREGVGFTSFDDVYESAPDLATAYALMVDVLVAAAAGIDVVYAVPGSPVVAERTVELLRERDVGGELTLELVPGLSFADLAWARLGIDPMTTDGHVVDARAIDEAELAGALLIAQCDNTFVLSDVKLALLEHLAPDLPVVVLQRLGLPDEQVVTVALAELDHDVVPDHLTSLFLDAGATGAAHEMVRLLQLAKRLRDPGGCPWDAEQTHHSLTRYLLEESYEVVEAVEALPVDAPAGVASGAAPVAPAAYAALADELGDLLYQVVFHAVLAQEADAFTMADVARGVHDKLVRRHPHVFGDPDTADATIETGDVMRNWEQIKLEEKGTTSLVEGITPGLPSLLYTNKLFRKAASIGLEPGTLDEALDRADAAVSRMRTTSRGDGSATLEADLAQLLAAAVVIARASGVDAESALRGWAATYRERFEAMEHLAAARDVDLGTADVARVAALWLEAGAPASPA